MITGRAQAPRFFERKANLIKRILQKPLAMSIEKSGMQAIQNHPEKQSRLRFSFKKRLFVLPCWKMVITRFP
jgi:hypothetical protein